MANAVEPVWRWPCRTVHIADALAAARMSRPRRSAGQAMCPGGGTLACVPGGRFGCRPRCDERDAARRSAAVPIVYLRMPVSRVLPASVLHWQQPGGRPAGERDARRPVSPQFSIATSAGSISPIRSRPCAPRVSRPPRSGCGRTMRMLRPTMCPRWWIGWC